MKIFVRLLLFTAFAGLLQAAQGQTVTLLSNPDAGQGFAGWPIVFNNAVYFAYQGTGGTLAKYDGTNVTALPNPDAGSGFNGYPIVYNGNLYYQYWNASSQVQLAKCDGTTISLVPNPTSNGQGFSGYPIIFNNILYYRYWNASNQYQLARYDGTTVTLVSNPDAGTGMMPYTPVIYNNNLYFEYQGAAGKSQLAKYDGNNITLVNNPDAGNASVSSTVILSGNLYFYYAPAAGGRNLGKYDGTTITYFTNPDGGNGFTGRLIAYNSNIYFRYANAFGNSQLAKCDGVSVSLVANPGTSDAGFDGIPIVYGTNLYFPYFNSTLHIYQLAKYTGTNLSLLPNPDPGYGFIGQPVLYNGSLLWGYQDNASTVQLARYNGTTTSLVANPDAGVGITNDIFNNAMIPYAGALYFGYRNQASKTQLAKYVLNPNQWLGNSTDWGTTTNWSYGTVPVITDNVLIPATPNNPVISSSSSGIAGNITIQNNAALTISSGNLFAANGITVNPGGALVGSNNITATVTLQQSITGQRGYRVFANPFSTFTNIPAVAAANGITINTASQTGSGLTDSRTYSNSSNSWSNVTDPNWVSNTPYALFIRGLASEVNGLNYTAGPSAFTYSVSGTLNLASTTVTPAVANNFMVVGNPYAAPVTSSSLTNGAGKPYYVYQVSQGADLTAQRTKAGGWIAQLSSSTTATIPVLGAIAYQPAATTAYAVTTGDINTGGSVQTGVFGAAAPVQYLELNVNQQEVLQDKLFVRIGDAANRLTKFTNDNVNLYTIDADNKYWSIDARQQLKDTIALGITAATGAYSFAINNITLENTTVYVRDKLLNTQTELKQGASYPFTISGNAATQGEQRFELVFVSKAPVVTVPIPDNSHFTAQLSGNPINSNQPVKVAITGSHQARVRITDANGKTIALQNAVNGINYITANNIAKGVYFVQVTDGATSIINKLVIE